uniref:Uncharacterized protein n=1 Tax=Arundo donax TaxID=35708 RepID=A0A0A9B9A3_ARUDO
MQLITCIMYFAALFILSPLGILSWCLHFLFELVLVVRLKCTSMVLLSFIIS